LTLREQNHERKSKRILISTSLQQPPKEKSKQTIMYLKSTLLVLAASLATTTFALPASSSAVAGDPFSYLPVTFTLHAGTFSDNVTILADGQRHETSSSFPSSAL
jgi:hypothetical protein